MKKYLLNLFVTIYADENNKFLFFLLIITWMLLVVKWAVVGLNSESDVISVKILSTTSLIAFIYFTIRAYFLKTEHSEPKH